MGTPPPITLKPQAPRLNTLDGKTIYFVNTGYIGTDRLMAVMMDWFKANYPKTNIVYKDKQAGRNGRRRVKPCGQRLLKKGTPRSSGWAIEASVLRGRFASLLISNPK